MRIYKIKGQHMKIPPTKHDVNAIKHDVPLLFSEMKRIGPQPTDPIATKHYNYRTCSNSCSAAV